MSKEPTGCVGVMTRNRYRASLLIEASISLLIFGILFGALWSMMIFFQERHSRMQRECVKREILDAAARYAYRNGYLPLPDLVPDCQVNDPDVWLSVQLVGAVPWKELGLRTQPKGFVWRVSATAIRRPRPWCYFPADVAIEQSLVFWQDKYASTFARPRWCGLGSKIWWPASYEASCTLSLSEFVRTNLDAYKYTMRRVRNGDRIDEPHKLFFVHPDPSCFYLCPLPILHDLYKAERTVGGLYFFADSMQPFAKAVSPLGRFVGALCSGEVAEHELRQARFYGQVFHAVWLNEPVLAIGYGKAEVGGLDANEEFFEVWTREQLLALVGYVDSVVYTHPGYEWKAIPDLESVFNECGEWVRVTNVLWRIFDRDGIFFRCKEISMGQQKNPDAIGCMFLRDKIDSAREEVLTRYALCVGMSSGKVMNLDCCMEGDTALALLMLKYAESIYMIGRILPLRLDSSGEVAVPSDIDAAQEMKLLKNACMRLIELLEKIDQD